MQADGMVNVWVAPEGDASRAISLPTGNIGFYSSFGTNVAWTPEGKIVFASNEGGNADIWLMDTDGNNKKQLTANGAMNLSPVVSPDGQYIVYVSFNARRRSVWRMNANGSNQMQLTNGSADLFPSFTPDGKWVVYTTFDGPKPTSWKVALDGGTPIQIIDHVTTTARVSPDGKLLAYSYPESPDPFAPPNRIAVTSSDGTGKPTIFEMPTSGTVITIMQWAGDSKAILYTVSSGSVSNIWRQPLEGGPAKQVTSFRDSLISGFAFSNDGKQLVCTRGRLMRDAVLISDMK